MTPSVYAYAPTVKFRTRDAEIGERAIGARRSR
jgi:hypothetical protein